jgi:phospholipid transport system substrate-binding protein
VKTLRTLLTTLAALALLQPASAALSQADAETFLKKSVDEVVAAARKSKSSAELAERVRPILVRTISFPDMTRLAIGRGWREFSPAERDKAAALFTTLIIRTYSGKFTPGELPDIVYKSISSPAPGKVEAVTATLYQGSKYEVVYRLTDIPGKGWRVTDVVIEGVSMVANYRAQFDPQFQSGGAPAVIRSLEKTVASRP